MVQKYLCDTLQNTDFKIAICFFSLQGNPVLLLPWMVYKIFFLIANIIFYIVFVVELIEPVIVVFTCVKPIVAGGIHICK